VGHSQQLDVGLWLVGPVHVTESHLDKEDDSLLRLACLHGGDITQALRGCLREAICEIDAFAEA